MFTCEVCGDTFKSTRGLSQHVNKKHGYSFKGYYDNFIKKEDEGFCKICGNKTKFKNFNEGYKNFCSAPCVSKSEEIKLKQQETFLNNYGTTNPSYSQSVKEKRKQTSRKNFGTDCPFQSEEVKQKIQNTNVDRYGSHSAMKNENVKNRLKQQFVEKYGVDVPAKNENVKNKIKETNLKKYGDYHTLNLSHVKELRKKGTKEYRYNLTKNFLESFNNIFYIGKYSKHKYCIFCLECKRFSFIYHQVAERRYYSKNLCPKCYPVDNKSSYPENELAEFIQNLGFKIRKQYRIKNNEIDIYIEDKSLGIEFNGVYWHSERNLNNPETRHLDKTNFFKNYGIDIIHIFEDEWKFKKDIVKGRIKQLLGMNEYKRVNARNCFIREISAKEKDQFLDVFHLQGRDISKIRLGAFYEDELIAVMTFSRPNISKGYRHFEGKWELNRFCTNYNYHIPGIAGKLLEYFKQNYEWQEIFSYADKRWSNGNLYYKLGFNYEGDTRPNYWYVKNNVRIHRFNLRKGKDDPKDIPEWKLRLNEGYYRIWDCGNMKFSLKNKV